MLNKLNFYKNKQDITAQSLTIPDISDALALFFNTSSDKIRVSTLGGGTLGITYKIDGINSLPLVLKTYYDCIDYKQTLEKEFYLLKTTNTDMFCEMVSLPNENSAIVMDYVYNTSELILPEDVLDLIYSYKFSDVVFCSYSIENLIQVALVEIDVMRDLGLITNQTVTICKRDIDHLYNNLHRIPKVLCHGDLSNKNILKNTRGNYVVIDWEDAFIGIEDYDYLYWLSFFCNRQFYNTDVWKKCKNPKNIVRGIILLILVLKSALSFYNGAFKTNSLSSEARINEIIAKLN